MEWLTVMVVLTSMNVRAIRRCVMRTLCVTTQKGRMPAFANPDSMVMELFVKISLSVSTDPATLMLNAVSCKEVSCVPATLVLKGMVLENAGQIHYKFIINVNYHS